MNRKVAIISSLLFLSFAPLTLANSPYAIAQTITPDTCNIEPDNGNTGEYSDQQLQNIANQITVRVIGDNNGGSGTIFAKKGNSYLVVTNSHVILGVNKMEIKTPDGKTYSAQILPNTNFGNLDLAVLQFTSNQNYCLPKGIASFDINKDTEVLAAGYSSSKGEIAFRTGTVKQIISQPSLKEGYEIGYSSDIEQGMSGGAIIDSQGNFLGINGKSSYPSLNSGYVYADGKRPTDTEIQELRKLSWGIPIKTLLAQVKLDILTAYALPIPDIKQEISEVPLTGWLGDLEQKAKQITVRIDSSSKANGSGIIIAKEGDIYTVLTAAHVLCEREDATKPCGGFNYQILAPNGKQYAVEKSSIKLEEGVDLAVVKFRSQENYQVATLANYPTKTNEFMFTAGYPKLGDKSPWRFTLGRIFSKEQGLLATTQSDFKNNSSGASLQSAISLTGGYELVYSSITFGGMSGGPVLDSQGRVIGIHGRTEGEGVIDNNSSGGTIQLGNSLGIPVSTFLGIAIRLNTQAQKVETTPPPELNTQKADSIKTAILSIDISKGNTTASQWLERGNQLWRLRRYPEAIQAFEEAIKQKPKFIHLAYYGKGWALGGSKKYPEAIAALELAVKSKPDFVPAWNTLSLAYRESKQLDKALVAINEAIPLQPNNPNLYNQKSVVLSDLKRYKEAEAAINKAVELSPRAVFYSNRGLTKSKLGDKQGAINDYNQAIKINPNLALAYINRGVAKAELGDKQGAINDFNQAIKINPNLAQAYSARGIVKFILGDKQGAINDFNQAIKIDPNYAQAYSARGIVKFILGDKQGAINDFNQAIKIDPNYAQAYSARGDAKDDLGDKQGAINDYTQAIKIDPNNALTYRSRGIAKSDLGDKQGAISDFTQAIKIDPNNALTYSFRGSAKSDLGDKQGAISDFTQAIKIDPKYVQAYINRGIAKARLGDKQGAISDFTQAIKIDPKYALAHSTRGYTKYELGDKQGAISDYTQAIKIDPNDALAYNNRGIAKYELGDKQGAIDDYTQAIKIDPNDAQAYYRRGIAKYELGDKQGAVNDFTQAIKIDPNDALAYGRRGFVYLQLGDKQKAREDLQRAAQLFMAQGNTARYEQMVNLLKEL